jgi:hypothetical protein
MNRGSTRGFTVVTIITLIFSGLSDRADCLPPAAGRSIIPGDVTFGRSVT